MTDTTTEKVCTACHKMHPIGEFQSKRTPGVETAQCARCRAMDAELRRGKQRPPSAPSGSVRASDGYIKCSNCPRWCPPEDYVGTRGQTVAQCRACREKDARRHPERAAKKARDQTTELIQPQEPEKPRVVYVDPIKPRVQQLDMSTGEVLATYDTIRDAARAVFVERNPGAPINSSYDTNIGICLKGRTAKAYGYAWRYVT
jgi:hypothetical protein